MENQASNGTTSLPPSSSAGLTASLSLGAVAALVVLGCVVVVILIIFLVYRCVHKRSGPMWISQLSHRTERYSSMNEDTTDHFIIGFSNPIISANEPVAVLGYRALHNDTEVPGYKIQSDVLVARDCVVLGKELGQGWFGKVYEGEAYRLKAGIKKTKVVIKALEDSTCQRMKETFLKEIEMFRCITHKNVLSIIGQVSDGEPYLVMFEHFPLGDLKQFLRSHDRNPASAKEASFTLRCAIDISSGLHCLHANRFYHRDLAARNCVVASDFSVKIGDYGISAGSYQGDYYRGPSQVPVPIRWIAPEDVTVLPNGNLETRPPTEASNVWSFGVTLWEVVELGRQPYEDLTDPEVLQSVITDGLYKLPEPDQAEPLRDLLYEVMRQCWVEPERRPGSRDLESTLMSLMSNQSVPCLTAGKANRAMEAGDDSRVTSQPVAVVHPLRPDDVPVTQIFGETPPPVTYIGAIDEPQPSDVSAGENKASDLVVMPGEVTRRKGSILRQANSKSKGKVVHFPANILALRTIHKYESTEIEDDYDFFMEEDDDHVDNVEDNADDSSMWPRNYPIASEEIAEPCSASREMSLAVERKVKKSTRRAKLQGTEEAEGEWMAVLDSNPGGSCGAESGNTAPEV